MYVCIVIIYRQLYNDPVWSVCIYIYMYRQMSETYRYYMFMRTYTSAEALSFYHMFGPCCQSTDGSFRDANVHGGFPWYRDSPKWYPQVIQAISGHPTNPVYCIHIYIYTHRIRMYGIWYMLTRLGYIDGKCDHTYHTWILWSYGVLKTYGLGDPPILRKPRIFPETPIKQPADGRRKGQWSRAALAQIGEDVHPFRYRLGVSWSNGPREVAIGVTHGILDRDNMG